MNRNIAIKLILESQPSKDLCVSLRNRGFMEINEEKTGYKWNKHFVDTSDYPELLIVLSWIKEDLQLSGLVREMAQIVKLKSES